MPKGFFTQSADILLSKESSLESVIPLLSDFEIVKRTDKANEFTGPSVLLPFRPEVNGYAEVDIRNKKWPDHMGDPKSEPKVFAGWSMGYYGPFAFPGGLQRARQQLWSWREGKELVDRHVSFIHVAISYVFGAAKPDPIRPADCHALAEIEFVTRVALALLKHPDALMYFNSNGEVLRNDALMRKSLEYHAQHDIPPFEIWANIRLLNPGNGWLIMDTVGMGQLDLSDLEACFRSGAYDMQEVDRFLRNGCLYLLKNGEVLKHKDTMDGPGGVRWRAYHTKNGACPPPRRVIRWFPEDGSQPPKELLANE